MEGLYIVLISLHGLVRGQHMELGKDADTGGQVLRSPPLFALSNCKCNFWPPARHFALGRLLPCRSSRPARIAVPQALQLTLGVS